MPKSMASAQDSPALSEEYALPHLFAWLLQGNNGGDWWEDWKHVAAVVAMLNVHIRNALQDQQFMHSAGTLELGRGVQRDAKRFIIKDERVSRDHLQVDERPNCRIRITNLSQTQGVKLPDGSSLEKGAATELELPLRLTIGRTMIDFESAMIGPIEDDGEANMSSADTAFDINLFLTIAEPVRGSKKPPSHVILRGLGDSPAPEQIAYWLESVMGLQRAPAGSKEFYDQTARALVEWVDLELGIVLLRRHGRWEVAGYHAASDKVSSRYSRTLLDYVVRERRTFYQDMEAMKLDSISLVDVEAVVVSPIFDLQNEVAGVLYGSRSFSSRGKAKIRPLEAQMVQLLAAGVSDNLARTAATKTRSQFEQFFSPQLVRELERDPAMLEGRNQEVTILVSDLRGFTSLSERLGAETSCRIVRDLMERFSEQIMAQGGVIVDYAGDGILAMWNAPIPQEDHVVRACRAALAMLRELPALDQKWQTKAGGPLAIGIGINTGQAQVGNTGSSRKLKYGPHGLTVNLASRIQDATKKASVPVLIPSAVKDRLPVDFSVRKAGVFDLRGVSEGVVLYELCEDESFPTETP
jgi:adenylate cyclase